jgi:hypothetical protein
VESKQWNQYDVFTPDEPASCLPAEPEQPDPPRTWRHLRIAGLFFLWIGALSDSGVGPP